MEERPLRPSDDPTGDGAAPPEQADPAAPPAPPGAAAEAPAPPAGPTDRAAPAGGRDPEPPAPAPVADAPGGDPAAWSERAAERARGAWNAGRALAERTAREFQLKRSLNHTRADKELTLKRIGEEAIAFLSERALSHPELVAAVAGIDECRRRIAAKEAEERDLEAMPRPEGWFGRIKRSIAKAAGYTKVKIEHSMLRNEHESKVASLGQFIYSRKDLFVPFFAASRFIPDLFRRVESLEREIADLERALAELG